MAGWEFIEIAAIFLMMCISSSLSYATMNVFSRMFFKRSDQFDPHPFFHAIHSQRDTFSQQVIVFWKSFFKIIMTPYCYLAAAALTMSYCIFHLSS